MLDIPHTKVYNRLMLLGGHTSAFGRNRFSYVIKMTSFFRKSAYTSSFLLFLLILFTLCPLYFVPEVTEAATKNANPATLSFAFTDNKDTASVSLTVTDENGNFATSTEAQKAAFSLSTDNATGYTLNLRTTGATTTLSDGTHSINTIASSGITADNFAVNTYGILPSKYNGTANTTNYYPASSTGFKMDETSAANSTANTYTIGLGLKANYATTAGTYTTANTDNGNTGASLVLEYVANAVTYSINYYTNTNDTVTGMPSINPQTGTVSQGTTSTSVNLASAPSRTGYTFLGWCMGTSSSSNITTTSGVDSCGNSATNQFTAGQSFGIDATVSPDTYYMYAMWQIQSYTQTVRYRYENADGSFGSYTTVNETKNYGTTYSWSTANISNFDSTIYQSNSISSYTVTGEQSTDINIYRNTFTCTKRYRLQNADGTFPSTYDTSEGTITGVKYGASCSYTKTITDYRGSSTAANGASGTGSSNNVTSNRNIDIDFYRNTYTLTVTAGTNTSSATGSGTYRWGQTVTVGVTKATNVTCTTYTTPTWTATAGTAPSAGASSSYTMPKSNATVTATSTASNVSQTITLSRGTGASKITIAGTDYTGTSVSLTCGTYNISGGFSSGYEFNGWSRANGVTVANTSSASTTMTVSGTGTLTLNAKQSCVAISGTMQAFTGTGNYCSDSGTLTDSRDNTSYKVAKLADGKWWMLDNLRLGSTATISLDSSNTNLPSGVTWTLPASGSWSITYTTAYIISSDKDKTTTSYGSGSGKIGVYYNYCAASAGDICDVYNPNTGSADRDICPKGWRIPKGGSSGEYNALYTNSAIGSDPTKYRTALSTPLSGTFDNGSVDSGSARYQGSYGYFWSSTRMSNNSSSNAYFNMHGLFVDSSNVYPTSTLDRKYAYSVRCILK